MGRATSKIKSVEEMTVNTLVKSRDTTTRQLATRIGVTYTRLQHFFGSRTNREQPSPPLEELHIKKLCYQLDVTKDQLNIVIGNKRK